MATFGSLCSSHCFSAGCLQPVCRRCRAAVAGDGAASAASRPSAWPTRHAAPASPASLRSLLRPLRWSGRSSPTISRSPTSWSTRTGRCRRRTSSRLCGAVRKVRCCCGLAAGDLWIRAAAAAQDRCQALRLCAARSWPAIQVFFLAVVNFAAPPFRAAARRDSGRRHRAQSAAAVSGDGDPSADALPGLRGILGAVRLCARRTDDALSRRKVDQDYARAGRW